MSTTQRRQPPPDTPSWERRLVSAAAGGDRDAQHRLLVLYEPMVRYIVRGLYLPGGEREDLAQEARVGLFEAARDSGSNAPCSLPLLRLALRGEPGADGGDGRHTDKHLLLTTGVSMQRLVRSERPEFVDGGDEEFLGTSPASNRADKTLSQRSSLARNWAGSLAACTR